MVDKHIYFVLLPAISHLICKLHLFTRLERLKRFRIALTENRHASNVACVIQSHPEVEWLSVWLDGK